MTENQVKSLHFLTALFGELRPTFPLNSVILFSIMAKYSWIATYYTSAI